MNRVKKFKQNLIDACDTDGRASTFERGTKITLNLTFVMYPSTWKFSRYEKIHVERLPKDFGKKKIKMYGPNGMYGEYIDFIEFNKRYLNKTNQYKSFRSSFLERTMSKRGVA